MRYKKTLVVALVAAAAVGATTPALLAVEPTEGASGAEAAAPGELAPAGTPDAGREVTRVAAALPDYTLDYLAQNVPYAIKGNVTDIAKVPPQVDDLGIVDVFTDVVITVDEDLFGKYTEKTITLRVRGGDTGNGVVVVDGAPDFKMGEPVFVLVAEKEPDSIYGDNYYVAGMQHGKYSLDEAGNALSKDPSKNMSYENLKEAVAGTKG